MLSQLLCSIYRPPQHIRRPAGAPLRDGAVGCTGRDLPDRVCTRLCGRSNNKRSPGRPRQLPAEHCAGADPVRRLQPRARPCAVIHADARAVGTQRRGTVNALDAYSPSYLAALRRFCPRPGFICTVGLHSPRPLCGVGAGRCAGGKAQLALFVHYPGGGHGCSGGGLIYFSACLGAARLRLHGHPSAGSCARQVSRRCLAAAYASALCGTA